MEITESIDKLASGMALFRQQLKQPELDAKNPFFKNDYLTLKGVEAAIDPALKGTGLSYIQLVYTVEGSSAVKTMVMHSSGQRIVTDPLILRPTKNDPQGQGSAITYAKRYQLMALFGVVGDKDDDGNAASRPQQRYNSQRQAPQQRYNNQPQQAPQQPHQENPLEAEYRRLMMELINKLDGDSKRAESLVKGTLGEGKHSGQEYVNALKALLESEEQK